jgi:hypothetical protein
MGSRREQPEMAEHSLQNLRIEFVSMERHPGGTRHNAGGKQYAQETARRHG